VPSRPALRSGHVLPDVLDDDLTIVFCGSAAGRASARAAAYFAGPGNRFWPTLHRVGLTPKEFAPHEFPDLPALGIGLTDMVKTVSGADHQLPRAADDAAALRRKIARHQPAWLAFVGKRAARAFLARPVDYGTQPETIGATRLFVLPSPSGAARRWWDETWWQALAAEAKGTPAAATST